MGLISLIRPSNALIILFFLLYGIQSAQNIKERFFFLLKIFIPLSAIALLSIAVWIPQFIYWKIATGHYLFYSYTDERFYFNDPHIVDGLFSFQKGWLVYTPIMFFAIVGLFISNETLKKTRVAIVSFMIINIYIIFSWWCWWYGGTFGQRSMIESYVLLAIPFASFIKIVIDKKIVLKILLAGISVFLIWLNIFQTYQYEYKSLHWDGMTKELYFKQFGKLDKIDGFDAMVHWPNYDEARRVNKVQKVEASKENENGLPADKKIISRKKINLKAYNNNYVCDDGNRNHIIVADKPVASSWELFDLIEFDDSTCVFISYENSFISAEINLKNELTATRKNAWAWETFKITQIGNNKIALKADNGKYISIDESTLELKAVSDTIGTKEVFEIINK